jgi:hypothetical protein
MFVAFPALNTEVMQCLLCFGVFYPRDSRLCCRHLGVTCCLHLQGGSVYEEQVQADLDIAPLFTAVCEGIPRVASDRNKG